MATQLTDPKGRPIVVVTGMGIVTSLGRGKADNWAALTAGRSGIKPIRRFPIEGLRTTIAGTIDCMGVTDYSAYELSYAIAEAASLEAVTQSGIASAANFPGPLFIATPPSELEWPALRRLYDDAPVDSGTGYQRLLAAARTRRYGDLARHAEFASIADRMQVKFGTRGEPISICTACASGATTIQMGVEAIRRGEATAALCVGADATVHPEGLIRFSLLSALSTRNSEPEKASRPFASDRDGFVIAEGAGAVVLESISSSLWREALPFSALSVAAARRPTTSTARALAPTAPQSSVPCARHSPMPARPRTRSTTSTHTAPARPKMTRWNTSR